MELIRVGVWSWCCWGARNPVKASRPLVCLSTPLLRRSSAEHLQDLSRPASNSSPLVLSAGDIWHAIAAHPWRWRHIAWIDGFSIDRTDMLVSIDDCRQRNHLYLLFYLSLDSPCGSLRNFLDDRYAMSSIVGTDSTYTKGPACLHVLRGSP